MSTDNPKTVLAFDFGLKKIGVAVGQTLTQTATALTIIPAQQGLPDWATIAELITTWGADFLVVGLPLNMDGSEQPISTAARKFAKRLHGRFHLPVHLADERLTSVAARQHLAESSTKFGHKISNLTQADSVAAQLILEAWFAENH